MDNTKPSILVVDDAEDSRALLEVMLSDRFEVTGVNSGVACLEQLKTLLPNLILLDIHMPGMNGFEVCREFKLNAEWAKIPVMFVSGSESIEERLRAYDEGADDYLSKPFTEEALLGKVENALAHQREVQALQARSAMAMSTAMEAMTASSELGILLSFIRASMEVNDVNGLAQELSKTLEQFGLSAYFMIHRAVGHTLFGCKEDSMEGKVLVGVTTEKSIYEFGRRVIFIRKNVRLLIENMPFEQPEHYGRLKDNLLILCDCVSARAESLKLLQQMKLERDGLMDQILKRSEIQLNSVRQKLDLHAEESQRIMRKMVEELDERLLFLGLEDDQEKSLRHLADQTHENIESLGSINAEIYTSVDQVMQGLYQLVQSE